VLKTREAMPDTAQPESFTRYDATNYLRDEERIHAYLETAKELASEDTALLSIALDNIARARNPHQ